jgi:predicted nucleic acid-binding protein
MISRSLSERRVFVDSSAYLAILDRRDQFHEAAMAIGERLAAGRYRLITANTIVIEAHALILSTLGIERASGFLRDTERSGVSIVRVRASDEERARQIIFRYQDKRFSFTDAISFVLMERLGIRLAFSFDRNFAQYGLTMVTAGQL